MVGNVYKNNAEFQFEQENTISVRDKVHSIIVSLLLHDNWYRHKQCEQEISQERKSILTIFLSNNNIKNSYFSNQRMYDNNEGYRNYSSVIIIKDDFTSFVKQEIDWYTKMNVYFRKT